MEIKQIEERIAKKQEQIQKIEKRIAKWQDAKSDKGFKKDLRYMEENGLYYNWATDAHDLTFEDMKASNRYEHYIKNCDDEIRIANSDLAEANLQLEKYNNMLKLEQVKQAKLSSEKIQVIVDFLADWKEKVIKFTHNDVKRIKKYYEADHKVCDLHNNHVLLMRNGTYASEEEFQEAYKAARKEAKELKAMVSQLTWEVYSRSAKNLTNDQKLSDILDKEVDRKYLKLVDSITAKIGEIQDTSSLHIGYTGEIEGYITGSKGKVHVQTIGAGGVNDNIILDSGRHGQCYHFRTLVNLVK